MFYNIVRFMIASVLSSFSFALLFDSIDRFFDN